MDANNNIKPAVSHQLARLKLDDAAIEKAQHDHRANIPFDVTGNLKGLHLRIGKSGNKTFYLIGKVKGSNKTFFHKCGEYQSGVFGVFEIQDYVNELVKQHKHRKGYWKSNPNEENITKQLIQQTQSHTIRQAIEVIARESFPHIKTDGTIDKKSIQQYSQFLFGWNKRSCN